VQALAKEGMVAAILDGRRGQVFGALYAAESSGLRELVPACVLDATEFLAVVEGHVGKGLLTIATTRPELFEGALAKSSLAAADVVRVSPVLAPSVARIGIERASRGELTNALELDANYIRRSDAEVLWKAQ
jgi:tRNA A37 threonylcarbamoyladenosine modification protein TsaB